MAHREPNDQECDEMQDIAIQFLEECTAWASAHGLMVPPTVLTMVSMALARAIQASCETIPSLESNIALGQSQIADEARRLFRIRKHG